MPTWSVPRTFRMPHSRWDEGYSASRSGFLSHGGGAVPIDGNGLSWNKVYSSRRRATSSSTCCIISISNAAHGLAQAARLRNPHQPTGREVCGYLLVRGSVHAHAYELVLKKLTGVRSKDAAGPEHRPRPDSRMPEVPGGRPAPPAEDFQPATTRRWRASGGTVKRRFLVDLQENSKSSKVYRTAANPDLIGWPRLSRPSMRPRRCLRSPRSSTRPRVLVEAIICLGTRSLGSR